MSKVHDGQKILEEKHRDEEDILLNKFIDNHEQQNSILEKVLF